MSRFRRIRILCRFRLPYLLTGFLLLTSLQTGAYEERISSFETAMEAAPFVYDAKGKGWARVSDERASHGTRSLKVGFLATESEIKRRGLSAFLYRFLHRMGLVGRGEEGKLALLGRETDTLPFDWSHIDALAFDVYNPFPTALELTLTVKSGLYEWDPTARFYRTRVNLPAQTWTTVRLSREEMGEALHPDGVLSVRMTLPVRGTLYLDNVRLLLPPTFPSKPRLVRLSWTRDPRTTQTISWQSRAPTGQVRFGPAGEPLVHTVISHAVRAFAWGYGIFHKVTLTGLQPDTLYDYQIRSGDGDWTPRKRFRTAPASDEVRFTFLAGSDTKGDRGVLIELLKLFEDDDPRFLIYVGDAVHTGGLSSQWERWFQVMEPFASRHAVMLAVGNHELGGDPELRNFLTFNALPGREAYYSFDYGPVHFVCLDSESGLYPEQRPWLEKDLSTTAKPWKVVYFHRPIFSSDKAHGSDEELRALLGPLFTQYHVNLVISGHGHLYERSKPIVVLASGAAVADSYREGTCYVVSGGAGAGLYEAKRGNWWTAVVRSTYHLCRIHVSGSKSMMLEAVDLEGRVFDRVLLENPRQGAKEE